MIIFKKIFSILTRSDKQKLLLLSVFAIIVGLVETFAVGILMPFLDVSINQDSINKSGYIHNIYSYFEPIGVQSFILMLAFALLIFYIVRALISIAFSYALNKFAFSKYNDIVKRIFDNYLQMEYSKFTNLNSSKLSKNILTEALNFSYVILYTVIIFSEVIIIVFLYLFLFFLNWQMTVLFTLFMLTNAYALNKTITQRIKKIGVLRESSQAHLFKVLGETFGNFKILKLFSAREDIVKVVLSKARDVSKANMSSTVMSGVPKIALETVGFVTIVLAVIYIISSGMQQDKFVPILLAYALAIYRILPSFSKILASYNVLVYSIPSIDLIYDDFNIKYRKFDKDEVVFNNNIELSNVDFAHKNNEVLSGVSLRIVKGEKIAFVGKSGAGKTTIVDIICGIYKPQNGQLKVDGNTIADNNISSWRAKIGYIPQKIYLFDGNVAQNVAFGTDFDEKAVVDALQKAKLYDFLCSEADGIYTMVGEGGIKLSGGQMQRIAIARAFYRNPEILVLDEATSALDDATEEEIMNEIYDSSKEKTLIIIAHRMSTIGRCDTVYQVENKRLFKKEQHVS